MQMVIKRVRRNPGLLDAYRAGDQVIRDLVHEVCFLFVYFSYSTQILGLPMCPPQYLEAVFADMFFIIVPDGHPLRVQLQDVFEYVRTEHMLNAWRRARFSTFDTPNNLARTNNPSEGANRGFQQTYKGAHPQLHVLLNVLNQLDHVASNRRRQLEGQGPWDQPVRRAARYRRLDERIAAAKAGVLADTQAIEVQLAGVPDHDGLIVQRVRRFLRCAARLI